MKKKYYLLFFLLCQVLLTNNFNCKELKQKPGLDLDKFAVTYTDYVIATQLNKNQEYSALFDSVLAVHDVTRDEFKECINYYVENPEEWNKFLDNVILELRKILNQEKARNNTQTEKAVKEAAQPKIP